MAALSLGVALSACGSDDEGNASNNRADTTMNGGVDASETVPSATDTSVPNVTPPNAATTMNDANILAKMKATDQMEIAMGNMAREKGEHAEVKAFGKMLVDDHTRMMTQGDAMASKLAITPVMSPGDNSHQMMEQSMGALRNASGAAFDSMLVALAVQGHQKTLTDLTTMASTVSNNEVKNLITGAMPVIQKHLERAQAIQGSLGSGNSGTVSGAVQGGTGSGSR
jgi:putative membrane protein